MRQALVLRNGRVSLECEYVVIQGRENVGYRDAFAFKKQLSQVIILLYEHFFFVTSLSSFNQSFFTFIRTKLITCILLHFIALAFSPIIINSFKVQSDLLQITLSVRLSVR